MSQKQFPDNMDAPVTSLDRIASLVGQGEIATGLQVLVSFLKGVESSLYNEAIVLSARLSDMRRRERGGVADSAELRRDFAAISFALLEILDEARRKQHKWTMPFSSPAVRLNPPADNSLEKIFGVNHLKSVA
jgi:hypothetical protein